MVMNRVVLSAPLFLLAATSAGMADDRKNLVDRLGRLPSELARSKSTDEQVARTLFGEALNRLPTESELEALAAHLKKTPKREDGIRDVLWALVNSKEFMKQHKLTLADTMKLSEQITRPKAKP